MTTKTLSLGIGCVVLAAALVWIMSKPGGESAAVTAATSTPALATSLAPDLTLKAAGSAGGQLVTSPAQVYPSDTLTTSHNGRGLLESSNGTVTVLDYDTTFTLTENDSTGTHIQGSLTTGAMWGKVEKVFGEGEYYQVKTQNAVAVVRGTSFGVSYKGGVTTLTVATGTVAFMPYDPVTGTAKESEKVLVKGGNKATIGASGVIQVSPLTTDDTGTRWYVFNVEGDGSVTVKPLTNSPANTTGTTGATTGTGAQSGATTGSAATTPAPTTTTPPTPAVTTVSTTATGGMGGDSCSSFSDSGGKRGSSLTLSSVSPASVSARKNEQVTLSGIGFECVLSVTIGSKVLDGESGFMVEDNATITLSSGVLSPGTFDIVMKDTLGKTATLSQALTVTP